ncbi:hypothetical protein LC048_19400 [Mesobacillus subterraneus]|uniref:hypothetical protein n=1 Tax=Mesobacillus subterraneus TaxID=285983 RepID=UPI001CFF1881|nr:hypothetical protein [Mesobacillus subterraneus]WLR54568.1 hypothetical protein LC048_19400 [Mesobacillus subterraneus]
MITRLELKKIVSSPIVLTLLLLFTAFNLYLIYVDAPKSEDVEKINEVIDEYGSLMDKDGRFLLRDSYEIGLESWNARNGKAFESASEFFRAENYYPAVDSGEISDQELEKIIDLNVKESILLTSEGLEEQYQKLDLLKNAEVQIELFGIQGEAAETVREQYQSLIPRLEEIKSSQDHLHVFLPGKIFRTHSLVFKTLFGVVLFQIMLLVVLFTAFSTNYEFDQGTHLVAFSTRRGRMLMWDKLLAALSATGMVTAFLLLATFGTYFIAVDYSRLWHMPISTGFMIEPDGNPFISWWNFSFIQYFWLGILLIFVLQILFTLITFVLSLWLKNSYVVFIVFAILFGLGLLVPGEMPKNSVLSLYTTFNPSSLVLGSKKWWMESGAFTTFKYFEMVTAGVWMSGFILAGWFSMKKFHMRNL